MQFTGTQDSKGKILISLIDNPTVCNQIYIALLDNEDDGTVNCTLKYILEQGGKKYDVLYEGRIYMDI